MTLVASVLETAGVSCGAMFWSISKMPTLRKDKGNQWMARVIRNGRQVACRMFPPGKKHGPEWRAAKEWEEAQREQAEAQAQALIPTALELLLGWGDEYLAHAERTMCRKTYVEKKLVMKDFFSFCGTAKIHALEDITSPAAYVFLAGINDAKGGNVANKYRKNLMAAWAWGLDFFAGFPQTTAPFGKVKQFQVEKQDRYVPPEEDVIKVLEQAKGQDLIMLLTLYYTGGRRSEIFRLSWQHDIRLDAGKIRLTDFKAGNGEKRTRWLQMHPELLKALRWWLDARPCKVDNVFMQDHCPEAMGLPYQQRRHFMARLCDRAKVKHFGFHAIRHKSAAITFVSGGLNAAQVLMGHYRATTTDIYTKSAGLYTDQSAIMTALGGSAIGQAVGSLLQKSFPHEGLVHGGNCNPVCVTH